MLRTFLRNNSIPLLINTVFFAVILLILYALTFDANYTMMSSVEKALLATVSLLLACIMLVLFLPWCFCFVAILISRNKGWELHYRTRQRYARIRKPKVVVADFVNGTEETGNHLVQTVQSRLLETLRDALGPHGDLMQLCLPRTDSPIPSQNPEFSVDDILDNRDVAKRLESLTKDLDGKFESAAANVFLIMLRWMFPLPGIRVQGCLLKRGTDRDTHELVVELADLVTGSTQRTYTFSNASMTTLPDLDSRVLEPHSQTIKPIEVDIQNPATVSEASQLPATVISDSAEQQARGHYRLGMVYLEQNLYQEAKACFEAAITTSPDTPTGQQAAAALIRSLRNAEATKSVNRFDTLAKTAGAWIARHVLVQEVMYARINPRHRAEILSYFGYQFWRARLFDEAIWVYQQAHQEHQSWYLPLKCLGDIYRLQGRYEQSRTVYLQARKLVDTAAMDRVGKPVAVSALDRRTLLLYVVDTSLACVELLQSKQQPSTNGQERRREVRKEIKEIADAVSVELLVLLKKQATFRSILRKAYSRLGNQSNISITVSQLITELLQTVPSAFELLRSSVVRDPNLQYLLQIMYVLACFCSLDEEFESQDATVNEACDWLMLIALHDDVDMQILSWIEDDPSLARVRRERARRMQEVMMSLPYNMPTEHFRPASPKG